MTRDELDKLHADTESTVEHTNISIKYALAILEWIRRDNQPYDICVEYKLQELKKQLQ